MKFGGKNKHLHQQARGMVCNGKKKGAQKKTGRSGEPKKKRGRAPSIKGNKKPVHTGKNWGNMLYRTLDLRKRGSVRKACKQAYKKEGGFSFP